MVRYPASNEPIDVIGVISTDGRFGCMPSQVLNCGGSTSHTNIWIHFRHPHGQYIIVILDEGNRLQSQCPDCNMFITWVDINRRHPTTVLCARGCNGSTESWKMMIQWRGVRSYLGRTFSTCKL